MLHNEARELLVEGYDRTYDVHSIEKRDTGSVALRTSQRRQKPKMTEEYLERLRTAIEKKRTKHLEN